MQKQELKQTVPSIVRMSATITHIDKKKSLAPKLRFKGFDDKWRVMKLEDVTEKIQDGTHFSPIQSEHGKYKYITSKNIRNGFMDLKDIMFLSDEAHREIYKRCDVKFNDILLTKDGASTGAACLNELHEEFSLLSSVAFLRANKALAANAFLYQIIAGPKGQQEIQASIAGQAITRITLSKIRNYKFYFPTLPEQQKIASFLSAVDEKIQQLTRKRELLEQYKKGVMQQLFSGKLRFKDENGKAFPKWEEKRLGDVCEYKNGGSFENLVCDDGMYNLISLNSIDINGKLKPEHKKVSENDNSLSKGDLVMVLSDVAHGYFLGMTDVIPSDNFVLNQRMGALKPRVNIDRYFLKTIINANQRYFKLMGQGSSQKNLSKDDVLNFTFQQPAIEEQKKIANYLSNIDNKIEIVNNQITQTQTFKKGLLQQMFV